MTRQLSRTKRWATAYWGCAVAHGLGHLLDHQGLRTVTKAALMPMLATWCRASGCPRLLVAALLASAAGDTLLEQNLILPGMAMYGAGHACYVTLFLRGRNHSSWQAVAAYGGLSTGIVMLLWPGLGRLRAPVAAYSLMLTATAVTSSWYGRRAGVGGALFLVSDALIGTRLAGHDFPTRAPLVGLTYTVAQYQLAAGIVTHASSTPPSAPQNQVSLSQSQGT
ncbi:lysoplasmalogenase [Kribbella sp. NPDC050459]|uniref:lysoplasmalogenase n=1 Tax=Kribbella sp. NPDC050459 TaxID=3155785 RepID=UPI0033E030D8